MTRAASPPLATSTLLRPSPANVARSASPSDRAPAARRKIHHRIAFVAAEPRLTSVAASRIDTFAPRIAAHVTLQSMRRAKRTIITTTMIVTTSRAMRARCLRDRLSTRGIGSRFDRGQRAAALPTPAVGAVRLLERRLRGGQAGDRHAVRRAGDVVEPDAVAELHRSRLTTMLAADADLQRRPHRPAAINGKVDQPAD